MAKLTPKERIEQLEKEVFDLRVALVFLVKDKDLMPNKKAYDDWRHEVRKAVNDGTLRDALRYGRNKTWHAT